MPCASSKHWTTLTQQHSITSQKKWIPSSFTVQTAQCRYYQSTRAEWCLGLTLVETYLCSSVPWLPPDKVCSGKLRFQGKKIQDFRIPAYLNNFLLTNCNELTYDPGRDTAVLVCICYIVYHNICFQYVVSFSSPVLLYPPKKLL